MVVINVTFSNVGSNESLFSYKENNHKVNISLPMTNFMLQNDKWRFNILVVPKHCAYLDLPNGFDFKIALSD